MFVELYLIKLLLGIFSILIIIFLILIFYTIKASHQRKIKDESMFMLVHDIRAPLTVIKGTANLLLTEDKNIDKSQKDSLLSQVQDTSDKLLLLVSDILDLSKMQTGKYKIISVPSDINNDIEKVYNDYKLMATQNKVSLNLELNKSIPHVNIDSEKIQRVLTNLVSNAIKYTPEGGNVTLSSYTNKDYVNVCVCDTGIGIDDEMKHKLFNQYVQGTKTFKSRKSNSSGIGLNVAKSIINLHKGKIWIEDNVPKGSKFIFSIPLNLPEF